MVTTQGLRWAVWLTARAAGWSGKSQRPLLSLSAQQRHNSDDQGQDGDTCAYGSKAHSQLSEAVHSRGVSLVPAPAKFLAVPLEAARGVPGRFVVGTSDLVVGEGLKLSEFGCKGEWHAPYLKG
jgi:hypothetical protein